VSAEDVVVIKRVVSYLGKVLIYHVCINYTYLRAYEYLDPGTAPGRHESRYRIVNYGWRFFNVLIKESQRPMLYSAQAERKFDIKNGVYIFVS